MMMLPMKQKEAHQNLTVYGKLKSFYYEFREACLQNYQLGQEISIDEQMVASKARVIFNQYMKGKPVCWGFKLFVLADSTNGYT